MKKLMGKKEKKAKTVEYSVSEPKHDAVPAGPARVLDFSTVLLHGDEGVEKTGDVAPPIHVTSTFRQDDPSCRYIYSRSDQPTRSRAEVLLAKLTKAYRVYLFSSGLAAASAILCTLRPLNVIALVGYHGTVSSIESYTAMNRTKINVFKRNPPYTPEMLSEILSEIDSQSSPESSPSSPPSDSGFSSPCDTLVILESPTNPDSFVADIAAISKVIRKHSRCFLAVDNTFASPYLVRPLELGADLEFASCTKFIGGHSDLVLGMVGIHPDRADLRSSLSNYRTSTGGVPGSMEVWLLLRSLRTMALRVERQSKNAYKLAHWLAKQPIVAEVSSPCLSNHPTYAVWQHQLDLTFGEKGNKKEEGDRDREGEGEGEGDGSKEGENGKEEEEGPEEKKKKQKKQKKHKKKLRMAPACFSFTLQNDRQAQKLGSALELFVDCTSLGGVESNVDWRAKWDEHVHPALIRVSVGVEDPEDLIADMAQAFAKIAGKPFPLSVNCNLPF